MQLTAAIAPLSRRKSARYASEISAKKCPGRGDSRPGLRGRVGLVGVDQASFRLRASHARCCLIREAQKPSDVLQPLVVVHINNRPQIRPNPTIAITSIHFVEGVDRMIDSRFAVYRLVPGSRLSYSFTSHIYSDTSFAAWLASGFSFSSRFPAFPRSSSATSVLDLLISTYANGRVLLHESNGNP